MSVVFRAGAEPAARRLDWWEHVVGDTLGPLELRGGAPDERDWLRVGDAGAARVVELRVAAAGGAARTAAHLRGHDPELAKIDVLAEGRGWIEHDGRVAAQRPGDLTLVDLTRPAAWAYGAGRTVAVVFPRAVLPVAPERLGRLTGLRIAGDRGPGALVSALARRLPGVLDDAPAGERGRVGAALLDLLAVALAGRLERPGDVPPEQRERALLMRALAFIEEHLGDPGLTPRAVAAAQYVSVRTLHASFARHGRTVAAWIRHRRLERCRADLLDPAKRDVPAGAIAARWGLRSGAHFSRAFRAAYGMPPSEYRRAAAAQTEARPLLPGSLTPSARAIAETRS